MLQAIDISLCLVTAVVVYRYAGDNVASPALGSAPGVVKKVAWVIALLTVCLIAIPGALLTFARSWLQQ